MISQSRTSDTHFCFESSNTSCPKNIYSTAVRAPLYVFLGAVIILTVCGNLSVILTVAHFKQLHTPTNYLVLSLAVADFLLGAVIMPPSMVRSLETCWYLGTVFCQIHSSMDTMLCGASIFNLSLISIDRYYAVCQPLRYQSKITNCVTVTMSLIFWSLSGFISFGMILFDMNTRDTEDIYKKKIHCEGRCFVSQSRMSSVVSSVLAFFIPAVLIVVLYLKILIIARRQACSVQSRRCANVNLDKNKPFKIKTEPKATRTLGIVVGVYLACWAPWFLCNLINPDVVIASPIFMEMLIWLAYLNSAINPIIYAFSFSWFRKPFNLFLKKIYQF